MRGVLGETIIGFPVADNKLPPKGCPHGALPEALSERSADRLQWRRTLYTNSDETLKAVVCSPTSTKRR
jgi:hypothetical protein